jgi:hypothetical protein
MPRATVPEGLHIDDDQDGIVVVRLIEDQQLVAIFHGLTAAGMLNWTGEAVDPDLCEYALLDSVAMIWPGRTSPIPYPDGYFDRPDDDKVEGYPGMSFSDQSNDELAEAVWTPIAHGPWVYFAKAGQRVKIGKANDVASRIATLQTGCPDKIEVVKTVWGGTPVERIYHKQFAHLRENGEWFRHEGDLAEFLGGGM